MPLIDKLLLEVGLVRFFYTINPFLLNLEYQVCIHLELNKNSIKQFMRGVNDLDGHIVVCHSSDSSPNK